MSDIVERLRSRASPLTRVRELSPTAALCREAAAEIERLRNVVQSMKEPMNCECGFSVEVCATNPCMRKKVHSAGLTPGSKWPEAAPIGKRIEDTATSHEAKPFMMLSCREAGRCLHNLPGCICEVDPGYDVDLRLSAGTAELALDELDLLIQEYDPEQSDWRFRKSVMMQLIARIRPATLRNEPQTVPTPDAATVNKAFDHWSWTKDGSPLGCLGPGAAARQAFQAGINWALALSRPQRGGAA